MSRIRKLTVFTMVCVVAAASAVQAQSERSQRSRRGGAGRGFSRRSLIGLLRIEQVQKELNLTEEQTTKVRAVAEKLSGEMSKEFAALREIDDRQQQRAKMTELIDKFDKKSREEFGEVLTREQMMRLYQIRMQVRSVVDNLTNKYIAGRLKLTDEQKAKVVEINKDTQAKTSELFGSLRNASREQRSGAYEKMRKIRADADEKALGLLTPEQKESFEKMKGKKFEFQMDRRR